MNCIEKYLLAWNKKWPVLKTYEGKFLNRIAMPIGGIGTGCVSLGGRGNLQDWEIMNRPAKGYTPCSGSSLYSPFFCLYTRTEKEKPVVRVLEGPVSAEKLSGSRGSIADAPGMPRFSSAVFAAAYPMAQVILEDNDVPITVRLEAFNPMIPCDSDKSGLPLACLRYVLKNRSDKSVDTSITAVLPNMIGIDGSQKKRDGFSGAEYTVGAKCNCNEIKKSRNLQGIIMTSEGVNPDASAWGSLAIACLGKGKTSFCTGWSNRSWGGALEDFWDDIHGNGMVSQPKSLKQTDTPMASISRKLTLAQGEEKTVTFLMSWYFPNRISWTPKGDIWAAVPDKCDIVGNYYTTKYKDAWQVLVREEKHLLALEEKTIDFVKSFIDTDMPVSIKEAALFNLSTLRSQTCFRTPDGKLWGWEGTFDNIGSCHGNCTHVWNYESATAHLFGDLARSMRETEFLNSTKANGFMHFRASLPLRRRNKVGAAADGQMGCILKLYREWQLSGDNQFLAKLYPKAKKALSFAWIPGGWDADKDGVMEGCQHNTLDVEYYGPNPLMQLWYLAALRASEEMAENIGDKRFSQTCRNLFEQGTAWTDKYLFNGEYYEHEIRIPESSSVIAKGLMMHYIQNPEAPLNPRAQLGKACLIDQLVGQSMATMCNLGRLIKESHCKKTLCSIMKYNFHENLQNHFCHTRTYARDNESALLMASHPKGRHSNPILHYNEAMTGFEYSTAAHLIQEGMEQDGLKVIRAIRSRFDGYKRNPFNEAECGHHYARALASWNALLAWTGFHYSAVTFVFTVGSREGTFFFSTGDAWGTYTLKNKHIDINVKGGQLIIKELNIGADI